MPRGRKKKTETVANVGNTDTKKGVATNTISEENDTNSPKKYNKRKRKHSVNILVDVEHINDTSELSYELSVNKRNKTDQKEIGVEEKGETGGAKEEGSKEEVRGETENIEGTALENKRMEEIKIQKGNFSDEGSVIVQENVVKNEANEMKLVNEDGKEENVVTTKGSKRTAGRRSRKKKTETLETEALNEKNTNQSKDTSVYEIAIDNLNATSTSADDMLKPKGRGRPRKNSVTDETTKKTDKKTNRGKRKIKKDEMDTDKNVENHETLPNDGGFVSSTTEATKEHFNLNHPVDAINSVDGDNIEEVQKELVVNRNENIKRENTKIVHGQETDTYHEEENGRSKLTDISNDYTHCLNNKVELEVQQKGNGDGVVEEEYNKENRKRSKQWELGQKEVINVEESETHSLYKTKGIKPLEKKDLVVVAREVVQEGIVPNVVVKEEVLQEDTEQERVTQKVAEQEIVQEKVAQKDTVQEGVMQKVVVKKEATQEGIIQKVVAQEVIVLEEVVPKEVAPKKVSQEMVAQELKTEVMQQEVANTNEKQEEEDILATYLLNESKKDNKQILSELRDAIYNTINATAKDDTEEPMQEVKKEVERIKSEETHEGEMERKDSKKEKNKTEDRLNDLPPIEGINSEEMNILNKWFFSNKLKILECIFQNKKLRNHLLYPLFEICPSLKFNKSKIVIFLRHIKEKYEATIKQHEKEEKMRIQKSQCYKVLFNMLNNDDTNLKEHTYMERYISLLTNETNLLHVEFYIEYLLEKGNEYVFDMFLEHNGLSHLKYILLNMASKGVMKYHTSLVLAILNSLKKCDITLAHLKSTFIGMTINFIAKNKNDEVKGLDFRTENQTVINTAEALVAHWKQVRDKTVKGEIPFKKKIKTDAEISNLSNWSERSNNVADISSDRGSSNNTLLIKDKTEILQNKDLKQKEILMMERKNGKPIESNKETTDNNIMLSLLGCINKEHEKKKMRHLEYKKAKLEGKFKKHVAIKNSIEISKKKGIELDINREDLIKLKNETEMKEYNNMNIRKASTTTQDVLQYPTLDTRDVSPMKKMVSDNTSHFQMQKSEGSMDYHPPLYKSERKAEYNKNAKFSNRYSENYKKDYGHNRNDASPRGVYSSLGLTIKNPGNMRHTKDRKNLYNYNADFGSEHKNDYTFDSRNKNAKYKQEKFVKEEPMKTKYNSRYKTGWDNTVLNFDKDPKTYVETDTHVSMTQKQNIEVDGQNFSAVEPLPQSLLPLQELFPLPELPPLPLPKSISKSSVGSYDKPVVNKKDYDQEARNEIRKKEIRNVSDPYINDENNRFQKEKFTEEDPFKYPDEDFSEEMPEKNYQYSGNGHYRINNTNIYGQRKSIYEKHATDIPHKTNISFYEKEKDMYLNKKKFNDRRSPHMIPKEIHYPYQTKETAEKSRFSINTIPYNNKINDDDTEFRLQSESFKKNVMFQNVEKKKTFENRVNRKVWNPSYPSQIVKTGEIAKMDQIITLYLDKYNIRPFVVNTNDVIEKTYITFNNSKSPQYNGRDTNESLNVSYDGMRSSVNFPKQQELKNNDFPRKHQNESDNNWNRNNRADAAEEMLPTPMPLDFNLTDFPFLSLKNFPPPPFLPPPKENIAMGNKNNFSFDSHYSYDASKYVTENKDPFFKEHPDKSMHQFISMFDEDLQNVLRKNIDLTKLLMSKPDVVRQMLMGPQHIMKALNSLTEELKNLKERH